MSFIHFRFTFSASVLIYLKLEEHTLLCLINFTNISSIQYHDCIKAPYIGNFMLFNIINIKFWYVHVYTLWKNLIVGRPLPCWLVGGHYLEIPSGVMGGGVCCFGGNV